jgi:hypothetical protein
MAWSDRRLNRGNPTGDQRQRPYMEGGGFLMLKAIVIVFSLTVSGFMLWVAHTDAHFAQLPKPVLMKRAV